MIRQFSRRQSLIFLAGGVLFVLLLDALINDQDGYVRSLTRIDLGSCAQLTISGEDTRTMRYHRCKQRLSLRTHASHTKQTDTYI